MTDSTSPASEAVELIRLLQMTPLYEGHGEGSDLPKRIVDYLETLTPPPPLPAPPAPPAPPADGWFTSDERLAMTNVPLNTLELEIAGYATSDHSHDSLARGHMVHWTATEVKRVVVRAMRIGATQRPADAKSESRKHIVATAADARENAVDGLREALEHLVSRLDEVHRSPKYEGVWTVNQLHCGPYDGPTYASELENARAVLATLSRKDASND